MSVCFGKLHAYLAQHSSVQPGHVLHIRGGGLNMGYDVELRLEKAELASGQALGLQLQLGITCHVQSTCTDTQ